jgi:hypothetical protein
VRRRQTRGDPDLATESMNGDLVELVLIDEQLQRDVSSELDLFRDVDAGHLTRTELAQQAIAPRDDITHPRVVRRAR